MNTISMSLQTRYTFLVTIQRVISKAQTNLTRSQTTTGTQYLCEPVSSKKGPSQLAGQWRLLIRFWMLSDMGCKGSSARRSRRRLKILLGEGQQSKPTRTMKAHQRPRSGTVHVATALKHIHIEAGGRRVHVGTTLHRVRK